MIFESHAHYDDKKFDEDRVELLSSMPKQKIDKIVNVASDLDSAAAGIRLAEQYSQVYAAIGVHPSEVDCLSEEGIQWLREHAAHPRVVAIGEVGLDYYWEKEFKRQEQQRYWFCRQLQLAEEVHLPVIIHSRESAGDTLHILKETNIEKNVPVVIHCYSYSAQMAMEYIHMGYYIGVGGVITFKNAKKLVETVEQIPLERILIETDSPYLAPEPMRGKRNTSLNLPHVIRRIAEIKGITPEEVEEQTYKNAMYFYFPVGK